MGTPRFFGCGLLAGLIAIGGCDCGGDDAPPPDAGGDAAVVMDAGGMDAATDARIETDAGADGGVDAAPPVDAGPSLWYELGASAYAPHRTRVSGSAFAGGVSGRWLRSEEADLAVDAAGNILVVWDEGWSPDPNWEVHETRWDGMRWSPLGGYDSVSENDGKSHQPSVDVADDGTAVVAWADDTTGTFEIYVRRWDGAAWIALAGSASGGGVSNTTSDSTEPSIRLDPTGRPVVAWLDGARILLRRFDGTSWAELDGSGSGTGVGGSNAGPELEIATDGTPVLAWGQSGIRVLRYVGGTWVGLDGAATPTALAGSSDFSLALDAAGDPTLAWTANVAGNLEIHAARWDGAGFVEIGSSMTGGGISSTPSGRSVSPSVAVDPSGRTVVAWSEDETGGWNPEIYVRRFEAGAWMEIGGSATGGGVSNIGGAVTGTTAWSYDPELVVDADGDPIVLWQEWSSGNAEIYLRKWDGSTWVSLGDTATSATGISASASRSIAPALALDVTLSPVVAWLDVMGGHIIRVTRWDGTDWTSAEYPFIDVGVPINFGWDRSAPGLVLDDDGEPILVWADNDGNTFVDHWDGGAWQRLGGGSLGDGNWDPDITRDAVGPIVAYTPYLTDRYELHLLRWDGSAWGPLDGTGGDVSGTTEWARHPRVRATSDGRVIVAIQEGSAAGVGEIRVLVWDGAAWGGLSGSDGPAGLTDGTGSSWPPALALGAADAPIVAWFHDVGDGSYELRVLGWDGSAWSPFGADPVVATGFESIFTGSLAPTLTTDTAGNPVVGWVDDRTGQTEVYVRRWDGTAWVDDPGAADGGGISNSTAQSLRPSLASAPGRTCIAWDEFGRDGVQVLLRCTDI